MILHIQIGVEKATALKFTHNETNAVPWKTLSPRKDVDHYSVACDTPLSVCSALRLTLKHKIWSVTQVRCTPLISHPFSARPGRAEPVPARWRLRSLYCGCDQEPFSTTVEAPITRRVSSCTRHPYRPRRPCQGPEQMKCDTRILAVSSAVHEAIWQYAY